VSSLSPISGELEKDKMRYCGSWSIQAYLKESDEDYPDLPRIGCEGPAAERELDSSRIIVKTTPEG
jgi:hypothetical protein